MAAIRQGPPQDRGTHVMSLLSLLRDDHAHKAPADVQWHHDVRGYYPRLLRIRPNHDGLDGTGGVYVLWHRGATPHWLYVGATDDLAQAIERARDNDDVLKWEPHGGVYLTWAPIKPEFRDGVVNYLRANIAPMIPGNIEGDANNPLAESIAVIPPY